MALGIIKLEEKRPVVVKQQAMEKKKRSWPISRVLWGASRPLTAIPLGLGLLQGSSHLPASSAGHVIACLFGVAPGGGCLAVRVTANAVRSYRTFSPLPDPPSIRWPSAVCSLWPCSSPHGGRSLAVTLPYGARTFLSVPKSTQRLSGQLH